MLNGLFVVTVNAVVVKIDVVGGDVAKVFVHLLFLTATAFMVFSLFWYGCIFKIRFI